METLLHELPTAVGDGNGATYIARVHGERVTDDRWVGWLEFIREGDASTVMRTDTETTQATRDALVFWATGLEMTYLEGALRRAEKVDAQTRPAAR